MTDAWLDALDPDPRGSLAAWLAEARAAGFHEPEAAALATATPHGVPSVRMVLVRGVEEHDLRVYTNHESRKAGELRATGRAALCFHWGPPLRRQVRIEGRVERLTDDEARRYFESRARESRLGAWASPQSRPLADRAELDRRYAEATERFAGRDVPLPESWGGYRIVPEAFELWRNRPNRLHDRARYERAGDGWSRTRLGP
ncbi:MAG TPA: pyridoxamine 5'-phosphate oxidase [Gaiella sp.]